MWNELVVLLYYIQLDIQSNFVCCIMRFVLVIAGMLLTMMSVPMYYYLPGMLSNAVHTFVSSMSLGNVNSVSMLRQMGVSFNAPNLTCSSIFDYGDRRCWSGSYGIWSNGKKSPQNNIYKTGH